MPIIQYCLPSRNKALKKLLHTYWEICPKYDDNGKLKQEMILVVNAIRNDLVRRKKCFMQRRKTDRCPRTILTNIFEVQHYVRYRS